MCSDCCPWAESILLGTPHGAVDYLTLYCCLAAWTLTVALELVTHICSFFPKFPIVRMSDLAALTALFERHLATPVAREQAAAEREQRLADLLNKTLQSQKLMAVSPLDRSATSPSPSSVTTKTVSVDRPVLSSSATSTDFTAWVESCEDYGWRQKALLRTSQLVNFFQGATPCLPSSH